MKIDVSKVKKGTILKINGILYRVTDTSHTHMARGGATYTFKVKDIISGKTNTFTYNSTAVLEEVEVNTKNGVYLYNSGDIYTFMELDTGEMYEVPLDKIEDVAPYLKDNLDVYMMMYEGEIIGIILPTTIEYKIKSTQPGIKGDRAQAGTKPAILENGLEVQVPLHKNEGDTVVVNTLTGSVS